MEKNKAIIALVLCFACTTIGMVALFPANVPGASAKGNAVQSGTTVSLPANPPNGQISVIRGPVNKTYTLSQIATYVSNGTIPLLYYNYTLGYGANTNYSMVVGINPLELLSVAGIADAGMITVAAADYSWTFPVSAFVLPDTNYYKYSTDNATMLTLACGVPVNPAKVTPKLGWLAGQDIGGHNYYGNALLTGDASVIGSGGKEKVSNVTTLTVVQNWTVPVVVDGQTRLHIGYNNLTLCNFTSYKWGYLSPNNTWAPSTWTGITVASLVNLAINSTTKNYTVKFVAIDGYSPSTIFTMNMMVNGYSPGDMIDNGSNNAQSQLNGMGMQPMLATQENHTALDYSTGAFWLMIPGATKSNYVHQIVEIVVTSTSLSAPAPSPTIPGFPIWGISMFAIVAVVGEALSLRFLRSKNKATA
jgi:hypothetical protein